MGLRRGTGNLGNSNAATQHAETFPNYWTLNILLLSDPSPRTPRMLCPGPDPARGSELNTSQAEPFCKRTRAGGVRGGGREGSGGLAGGCLQRISCQGEYLVKFHAAGEPGAC